MKVLGHIACHFVLDFFQSSLINLIAVQRAGSFGREIDLPLGKEGVVLLSQKAAANMLSENAPILIGRIEMLSNARRGVFLSGVRADADDTFYAMSHFTPLEENIDSIIRHLSEVFAPQTRQP